MTTAVKRDIRSLSLPALEAELAGWGEPRFRARQLYEWLWSKTATSFDAMSNLSKDLRAKLQEEFSFHTLTVEKVQRSADGTIKSRLLTHDWSVEQVLTGELDPAPGVCVIAAPPD